ncbi:complement component C8 gamma chain isoform X1 [Balearica regulorum gibbericeps]|uniref:complement component C8 gamma chain isoform X1 n=1 Tax=Balearica regulorum gibbericeps TaxID=100784 RepID=UPI003F6092B4
MGTPSPRPAPASPGLDPGPRGLPRPAGPGGSAWPGSRPRCPPDPAALPPPSLPGRAGPAGPAPWWPWAPCCSSACCSRPRRGWGGGRPLPRARWRRWRFRGSSASPRDGMCWEIRQRYLPAQAHGRFLLKGRGYGSKVDVVVGETDHNSYAILYYQKGRSISVKLYGRSSRVSDAVAEKFEQHVRAVGLSEDVTYYFPTYGFCDSADEFHILDETKP